MREQRLYGKLNKEIQKGILTTVEVTPTAEGETITPKKEYDGFSSVTVPAEPNLIPENIVEGKDIYDVEGTAVELYKDENLTPENIREGITVYEGTVAETTGELEPFIEDPNLTPENIKSGVVIYEDTLHEVVGTYIGSDKLIKLVSGVHVSIDETDLAGATEIMSRAFGNHTNLIQISIPNSVTTIGTYAFTQCTGLLSAKTGDGLQYINYASFYGASFMEEITIGEGIRDIATTAFASCTSLRKITCKAINPPTIQSNTFQGVPSNCAIYVPADSVNTYKSATNWSARATYIQAIPS